MDNKSLNKAKKAKNDEFYTLLEDIESEINYYRTHFQNKVVLCNCNDINSNFYKYFKDNFKSLGLNKLIATSYNPNGKIADCVICTKTEILKYSFIGDGDFRSDEVIKLLRLSDVVVTNPPFSLFRELLLLLMEYNKQFLIIGNQNVATCKNIFSFVMSNKLWLDYSFKGGTVKFYVPDNDNMRGYSTGSFDSDTRLASFRNCCWYTNLEKPKRYGELKLHRKYDENVYRKYDNFDAIEVKCIRDIPTDYNGVMGVPITFLKYNDGKCFELVGQANHGSIDDKYDLFKPMIDGKEKFKRLLIRRNI